MKNIYSCIYCPPDPEDIDMEEDGRSTPKESTGWENDIYSEEDES